MTFNSQLQIYVSYGVSSHSHLVQHLIIQIHIITNNVYTFIHTILWECVYTLSYLGSVFHHIQWDVSYKIMQSSQYYSDKYAYMSYWKFVKMPSIHKLINFQHNQNTINHKSISFIIANKQNKQQLANLSKCIKLIFKGTDHHLFMYS